MEFNINAEELSSYLRNTSYIVSGISKKSLLSRILLEVKDDFLTFSLSNETDRATIHLLCEVVSEGTVYLTAQQFASVVQSLSGDINVKLKDDQLYISQPNLQIKIPVVADQSELYNGVSTTQQFVDCGSIDIASLTKATTTTIPFINTSSNGCTKGVCIKINDDKMTYMSCSGAVLAFVEDSVEEGNNTSIVVRTETLHAIGRVFSGKNVRLFASNVAIKVVGDEGEIFASLLTGQYPQLERIIEDDYLYQFELSREQLEGCLRCVSTVRNESKRLRIQCEQDSVTIRYGEHFYQKLNIDNIQGDPLEVNIDYELLQEAIRALAAAKPQFKITASKKLQLIDNNKLIIIAPQL